MMWNASKCGCRVVNPVSWWPPVSLPSHRSLLTARSRAFFVCLFVCCHDGSVVRAPPHTHTHSTSTPLFKSSVTDLGVAMLAVAKNTSGDDDVRRLATVFLVALCENGGVAIRKNKALIQAVVPMVIGLMSESEPDAGWAAKPYDPSQAGGASMLGNDDTDSPAYMGVEAMFRLSRTLHGGIMLPVAFAHIPAALKSANPAVRRAAALAPGLMGEGCHRMMRQQLNTVLGMVRRACLVV